MNEDYESRRNDRYALLLELARTLVETVPVASLGLILHAGQRYFEVQAQKTRAQAEVERNEERAALHREVARLEGLLQKKGGGR